MDQKRIVVVGYGGGGSKLVAELAKKQIYKITVITPFDYMEVSLLMTKVLAVGREEHEKAIFPLVREDGVEYIIDVCVSVSNNAMTTKTGRVVPFDVCVVAVGHNIPVFFPSVTETTMQQRKDSIARVTQQIGNARSIVISGGGPVGAEAAADIKLRNKNVKVYLVHSHGEVLSMMKNAFRLKASTYLEQIGVELVLGEKLLKFENNTAFLSSGRQLANCDLHLVAHSIGGNAKPFMPANCVDDLGYVKVRETFEVENLPNVFAFGDCSNFDPVKIYPKLDDQMSTLLPNIEAKLNNRALKEHKRGASFMGQLQGPALVAMGHGHPEGYGVGPDLPGCAGFCCWLCCFFGMPCSPPAGHAVAQMKNDFNYTIQPRKGKGISK